MKTFVVIGLGRFGTAAAENLFALGNEVLAIDCHEERITAIADRVTYAAVGDARDEKVLRSLGVKNYDCAIVGIGSDLAASALITMSLKEEGMQKIVCKASGDVEKAVLERIGANRVIIPERVVGEKLAKTLNSEQLLDFIELSAEYGVVEIMAPEHWLGKSLGQLNVRVKHHVNVIAVRRGKEMLVNLPAEFTFQSGDVAVVLGAYRDLDRIRNT